MLRNFLAAASAILATILFATSAEVLANGGGSHGGPDRDSRRVADLLDQAEIARLATTYAWAVDSKNIDLMMTIFSRDAEYDLSAYGYPSVVGRDNIRNMFLYAVFPSEKCSFSSISNVKAEVRGNRANGGDYFVHFGYDNPRYGDFTRNHVEGQHYYRFVKERGEWKISWMSGRPTFEKVEAYDPTGMRHCSGIPLP